MQSHRYEGYGTWHSWGTCLEKLANIIHTSLIRPMNGLSKRLSKTKCSLERVVLSCTACGESVLGKANTAISQEYGVIIYSAWFVHRPETFDVWLDKCLCFKFNSKVTPVVFIVPNETRYVLLLNSIIWFAEHDYTFYLKASETLFIFNGFKLKTLYAVENIINQFKWLYTVPD